MRRYSFIAIGGILGAISRYVVKSIHIYGYKGIFPLNTFIINISGSFLLAMLLTTALEVWKFDDDIRIGIGTGFLGAYTTFSTMCKESVGLIRASLYYTAFSYIFFSTILGLVAAYLGMVAARKIVVKFVGGQLLSALNESGVSKEEEES